MRVLFLSFAFPLPANNGHRMRTWSVLEALATAGHDVTLLTFGQPGEAGEYDVALRKVCRFFQWEIVTDTASDFPVPASRRALQRDPDGLLEG